MFDQFCDYSQLVHFSPVKWDDDDDDDYSEKVNERTSL